MFYSKRLEKMDERILCIGAKIQKMIALCNKKERKKMLEIRYVKNEDKEFWYGLDKHLPEAEFEKKVCDK